MKKKLGVICALTLALVAVGGLTAVADEVERQAGAGEVRTAPEGAIPVSVAGMTVFIDQETGELRQPNAEEAAELAQAMQRMLEASAGTAAAAPKEIATKTGGVALEVGPDQLNFSVATVAEDGTVSYECLDSEHAARAHVHSRLENSEDR